MTNTEMNLDIMPVYKCLGTDFDRLSARVKSISNTIARYGYELTFKELERNIETLPMYAVDGSTKVFQGLVNAEVVYYTFAMPDFKVGNYTPIALIEHSVVCQGGDEDTKKGNMIRWFDQRFYKEIPEVTRKLWEYELQGHCDDCHDRYLRQKTVMLRNDDDGSYRQIGMSCLKRYLGITAFNVIQNFKNVTELIDQDQQSFYMTTEHMDKVYLPTVRYLAACCMQIEMDKGYQNKCITSTKAFTHCIKTASDKLELELAPYMKKAQEIKSFFEKINIDDLGDFESNVAIAVRKEYSDSSGLVAYAPVLYAKMLAAAEEKARAAESGAKSEYLGQEKGYLFDIDVTVRGCLTLETQWGYSNMITMVQDDTDNQLIWFTTTAYFEVGTKLHINKARIKAHKEYKGVKQTQINYVSYNTMTPN